MSATLLYLHGVGQGVRNDRWLSGLNEAWAAAGFDRLDLESRSVAAPDYVDLLKTPPDARVTFPEETFFPSEDRAERLTSITSYAREQRRLGDLASDDAVAGGFGTFGQRITDGAARWAPPVSDLEDADRYLHSKPLRAAVLQRVLSCLGARRDLVVVGHSLGSLVAIDLMAHLPERVRIRRMVTIGSPAGLMPMHRMSPDRLLRSFPHHQVRSWLNVLSRWDAVTGGRGISYLFPAAHDIRVALPPLSHSASAYLAHPVVAGAVADAWSRTVTASVTTGRAVDVRLGDDEKQVLLGVVFAHHTGELIKSKSEKDRVRLALQDVQSGVARLLQEQRLEQGRPVPNALVDLEKAKRPAAPAGWDIETALRSVIVAATTNQVAPYDIDVSPSDLNAVPSVWRDLGFTSAAGGKVRDSLKAAMNEFSSTGWGRFAVGAVGLALLATGPIGLMLAAPAGLAGAAAITASLAAFGPGGMVGGMILAGGLVGSGSVTAATAVLARDVSAQTLETEIVRRMAVGHARKALGLDPDHSSWLVFAEIESYLAAEHARLSPLSDEKSATIRELNRKVRIVRKAIDWMVRHGLTPTVDWCPGLARSR
ncbi:lipase family protein [Nocardioides sp. WL0053]|uniref:Lipase family protein n=1 Tax=Nocardioides jiangsuensis TaxID=2866161 RepID=A0ABS7RLT6_9ACTN|nr:alpha/beta hydrolase [Nocardioides jiangsuensis]MBY9075966.1 lipase family protein [Nocardioides jiangsuensis]